MSTPTSKIPSSKTIPKKKTSADKGVLSRLIGDALVSPPAKTAPFAQSQSGRDSRSSRNDDGKDDDASDSGRGDSPKENEFPSGVSLFDRVRPSDDKTVVLAGLPAPSDAINFCAQDLLQKGVKPLENVTIGDYLRTNGASKELMARMDYPDWDALCSEAVLSSRYAAGPPATDPSDSFSSRIICNNDS